MNAELTRAVEAIDLPGLVAELYPDSGARPGKKGSVRAVWRKEQKASVSLYPNSSGCWLFKDHGTGKRGNALQFLTQVAGMTTADAAAELERRAGLPSRNGKATKATTTKAKPKAAKQERGREVESYDYLDARGEPLFQVVRYADPKGFLQRRPNGRGGWDWGIEGVERVLYRLPGVLAQVAAKGAVLVVEGEEDVHTLEALGLVATCNPMGAGMWQASYSEALRGAKVLVLPDNDAKGREHARDVAKSLHAEGATVKIVRLPGLVEKGDVTDWLEAGGTKERLVELINETPVWRPRPPARMTADELMELEPTPVRHVIPGYLPAGLAILGARPKIGKSWLALAMAIAVSSGGEVLGKRVERGSVLYLALEDNADRLRDRIAQLQGKRSPLPGLHLWFGCRRLHDGGLADIQGWADTHPDARLIIIDTWARIEPPNTGRASDYTHTTAALEQLQDLAFEREIAVLVVHHTKKPSKDSGDIFDQLHGSTAFGGVPDTLLVMQRERMKADALFGVTGRDVDERQVGMSFDEQTGHWQVIGDADRLRLAPAQLQVLEAIEAGKTTPKELVEHLKKGRTGVQNTLNKLLSKGFIGAGIGGTYYLTSRERVEREKK